MNENDHPRPDGGDNYTMKQTRERLAEVVKAIENGINGNFVSACASAPDALARHASVFAQSPASALVSAELHGFYVILIRHFGWS